MMARLGRWIRYSQVNGDSPRSQDWALAHKGESTPAVFSPFWTARLFRENEPLKLSMVSCSAPYGPRPYWPGVSKAAKKQGDTDWQSPIFPKALGRLPIA